jgi:hypothetical protein
MRVILNLWILEENKRGRERSRNHQYGFSYGTGIHLKSQRGKPFLRVESAPDAIDRTRSAAHQQPCSFHHWNSIADILADVKDGRCCHVLNRGRRRTYHSWMLSGQRRNPRLGHVVVRINQNPGFRENPPSLGVPSAKLNPIWISGRGRDFIHLCGPGPYSAPRSALPPQTPPPRIWATPPQRSSPRCP